ncbi:hypothetical protein CABS01_15850 [Colletotrichum abscissum]|uniref:uncharacterized protein n=1 Tax=Colletotrichum abscissum TaxID=1671311 RepID=UPI0027D65656|nr:uncharacterized protein CABS01_15850 [Colletotrichum abscissum]KAK1474388.1 hypothetical protein CABS01_15850 [Colletotrichum abscissum]KAK1707691.1 hypothetical protein BDP67DRAFT_155302 [Colletotrichum lupini]
MKTACPTASLLLSLALLFGYLQHEILSIGTHAHHRLEGELGSRPTSRKGKRDDHHKERQHCGLTTFQHMPRGVRDKSPCWVFPFSAVVSEGRRCPSIGHHLSILTAQSLKLLSPTTQSPTNGVVLKLTCYLNSTEVPTRLAYTIRKVSYKSSPPHPTTLCLAGTKPVTG